MALDLAQIKARMTPAELEAHEAFFRPFWNEAMAILQAGFKSTQQATSPAPLSQSTQPSIQKKKRNEKTRRQYKRRTLQQMKSIPSNSDTIQTSLLSTLPSQTTKQVMRESACNAPLFTCQHALLFTYQHTLLLAYQHGSSLLAFQHALLLALSPEYMDYMEQMEATGQG